MVRGGTDVLRTGPVRPPDGAIELDAIEQRVIGSLLEKERTVPDTYPMTLNGVRTACNQTSGRDPVLSLGELEVQAALDRLRAHGTHPRDPPEPRRSHARSTARCSTRCSGSTRPSAPSSPCSSCAGRRRPASSARGRDRLHDFDSLDQVDAALHMLAVRDDPLVEELPRQPGQKETRWIHRLGPVDGAARTDDRTAVVFPTGSGRATPRSSTPTTRSPPPTPTSSSTSSTASPSTAGCSSASPTSPTAAGRRRRLRARPDRPRTSRWPAPTSPASTCRPAWSTRRAAGSPTSRSRSADLTALPRGGWAAITELVLARAPRTLGAAGARSRRWPTSLRPGGWLGLARARGHRDAPPRRVVRPRRRHRLRAPPPRGRARRRRGRGPREVEWYLRGPSSPPRRRPTASTCSPAVLERVPLPHVTVETVGWRNTRASSPRSPARRSPFEAHPCLARSPPRLGDRVAPAH